MLSKDVMSVIDEYVSRSVFDDKLRSLNTEYVSKTIILAQDIEFINVATHSNGLGFRSSKCTSCDKWGIMMEGRDQCRLCLI